MTASAPARDFPERVSPLVVKELRQGLRGKAFAIAFGLVLAACFTIALVAAVFTTVQASGGGRAVFAGFLTAQAVACFFVIPFTAYRAMTRELEDETWVLLALTGLGARAIVRGKWVSALGQVLLFASACTPFIVFSYFLNGVDLVQIATALVMTAAWAALLCAVGVALGTEGRTRPGRVVAQLSALAVLLLGTAAGVSFGVVLAEEGWRLSTTSALRNFCVAATAIAAGLTPLVLEAGAGNLALPTDAPTHTRRALALLTGAGLVLGGLLFLAEGGGDQEAALGQLFTSFFVTVAAAFIVAQPDGWPARPSRTPTWLGPGAWRGFRLALGLLVTSAVFWGALLLGDAGGHFSSSEVKSARLLAACLFYPVLFLSLGVLVGRLSPLRRYGEPLATRVGFLSSVALATAAAIGLSVVLGRSGDARMVQALSPFPGLIYFAERGGAAPSGALALLGATALLCTFLAALVLRERDGAKDA